MYAEATCGAPCVEALVAFALDEDDNDDAASEAPAPAEAPAPVPTASADGTLTHEPSGAVGDTNDADEAAAEEAAADEAAAGEIKNVGSAKAARAFKAAKADKGVAAGQQVEPVALTVRGLTLEVDNEVGGGRRRLLDGVTWSARPHETVAVMGASGAGKTTMLTVIANRVSIPLAADAMSGDVLFNELPIERMPPSLVAYVMQNDVFLEALTTHETLHFSAMLKVADKTATPRCGVAAADGEVDDDGSDNGGCASCGLCCHGAAEVDVRDFASLSNARRVDWVLNALGIDKFRDVQVSQLSGGQRRRLTIAMSMLAMPSVLLLDVPTSGLTSPQSHTLVMRLSQLAQHWGTTIITTIHQPSAGTFALFSHVLLMRRGGTVAYNGTCAASPAFFGVSAPALREANPADLLLELVVDAGSLADDANKDRLPAWPPTTDGAWPEGATRPHELAPLLEGEAADAIAEALESRATSSPGLGVVVATCFWRRVLLLHRRRQLFIVLLVQCIGCSLFMATLFWGQEHVRPHSNLIFFATQWFTFSSIRQVDGLFELRSVFAHERAEVGPKYVVAAWFANVAGELHLSALLAFLYAAILFFTTGLDKQLEDATAPGGVDERFLVFYAFMLSCWLASSFTVQVCL